MDARVRKRGVHQVAAKGDRGAMCVLRPSLGRPPEEGDSTTAQEWCFSRRAGCFARVKACAYTQRELPPGGSVPRLSWEALTDLSVSRRSIARRPTAKRSFSEIPLRAC